jgi:hypothetical protein
MICPFFIVCGVAFMIGIDLEIIFIYGNIDLLSVLFYGPVADMTKIMYF